ncbi:MAG: ABC-type transporter, integral rane subunit [Gemmatimonadetes bacterium]|nr:ABC-type transporter, integral rane subunit [Gemmatimonadota bacterium]
MDEVLLAGFLASAVRVSTPLLLAALGETLAERGGVINLGIEGAMLAGALGGTLGATAGGLWFGVLGAAAAGFLMAAIFAVVAIGMRADQIITGTAITLASVGLTGVVYREVYGTAGAGLSLPTFPVLPIPGLAALPVVGEGLFSQPAPTYLAWLLVPVTWWVLYRTRWGLALRAAGESHEAALAAGVRVRGLRVAATLIGGTLAGLAGGTLVLAQVGTFTEEMTAGRGYIAIAIVVLGRWDPAWVLGASLLFGGATATQFLLQAMGLDVPYQLFLMLPYGLALLALAGGMGRARAPGELGR